MQRAVYVVYSNIILYSFERKNMFKRYGYFNMKYRVGYVSALDISAPDISATGLSGASTFFLDSFFCSYAVSVCSSLRSR